MPEHEAKVAAFYDEIAASGNLMKKDINFWRDEFNQLAKGRQPVFFDLGCGDGREVRLYQETFGNLSAYYGLDLSAGMLKYIRSFAPEAQLIQADFNHLPFADNSLPLVWAAASYLHIPGEQIKTTLAELYRVMAEDTPGFISLKANPLDKKDYNSDLVTYYGFSEFTGLLRTIGFNIDCGFYDPNRDPRGVAWIGVFFTKPLLTHSG